MRGVTDIMRGSAAGLSSLAILSLSSPSWTLSLLPRDGSWAEEMSKRASTAGRRGVGEEEEEEVFGEATVWGGERREDRGVEVGAVIGE